MDEFAQTRAPDDLFDDDFTPLPGPSPQPHEPQPSEPPELQEAHPSGNKLEPQAQEFHPSIASPPIVSPSTDSQPTTITTPPTTSTVVQPQPRAHTPVRGDRTLTGGLAKPKLTEEELSAKLAAAKLNSAKRAEAHRLAEADEADFHAREAKAQVRRQDEGKARRVMDMERERNRIRKLGDKGGREWDEGKEERVEEGRGRGRGYRRGFNGGVSYGEGRGGRGGRGGGVNGLFQDKPEEEAYGQQRNGYELRGRGRGGRGRGDRGRGGNFQPIVSKIEQQAPDPVNDFPALPATSKPKDTQVLPPDKETNAGIASWADQVTEAQKQ